MLTSHLLDFSVDTLGDIYGPSAVSVANRIAQDSAWDGHRSSIGDLATALTFLEFDGDPLLAASDIACDPNFADMRQACGDLVTGAVIGLWQKDLHHNG